MAAQLLFEVERHTPLTGTPWRDDAARQALQQIADEALASFEGLALWPAHPRDDPQSAAERFVGLYAGAAGVVWALQWLAREGAIAAPPSFAAVLASLPAKLRELQAPPADQTPSYLMGDTGILLLQWHSSGNAAVAQQLFDTVQGNAHHPSLEVLWGSPGSLLAAIHMAEASGETRWAELVQTQLQQLADALQPDPETGLPIWQQDMYGRRTRFIGAGHGLVGNVYTALRAGPLLPQALRDRYLDAALRNLQALALVDGTGLNWHPMSDSTRVAGRVPPVQDCHGAPGIINRLAAAPHTEAWDTLLRAAGELTWRAGPLLKGPGLCHGTAGNALALMKLGERFGETLWWDRGRAMAWHAAEQVAAARAAHGHGRPSLWTGDLGVACVLWAGLNSRPLLPVFDVF